MNLDITDRNEKKKVSNKKLINSVLNITRTTQNLLAVFM
jgi:hypothetical protein